ncbi:MAG: AtpZ/AtpI family protein [Lachnospiraceae bacterium]|nr:AtpZ/AtpI family protein [Lachnospiraceae bacterium]
MKKKRSAVVTAFLMVSQIGISMLVPVFLGAWIGHWLDERFETTFWFLVFLLFGIMAAFRNVYRMLAPFFAADLAKEKKQQAYWESLRPNGQETETGENEGQESGAQLRRKREELFKKQEQSEGSCMIKSSRQEAEEEFDAWRRSREQEHRE